MNMPNGFRIQLDMSSIFEDNRKKSCIFVDRSMKCISELQKKICRLFSLKKDVSTMIFDNFVHPDESIQVLQENDVLKVIPKLCEEDSKCKLPTDSPVKSNHAHSRCDDAHGHYEQTSKSSNDLFSDEQKNNDKSYYKSNSLAQFIQALNGERSMWLDVPVALPNTCSVDENVTKSSSVCDKYQDSVKSSSAHDEYQDSVKSNSIYDETQESANDEFHDTASEMSITESKAKRKRKRHHKKKRIETPLPPTTFEADILPTLPAKNPKASHIRFGDDYNLISEKLTESSTDNDAACGSGKKKKNSEKMEVAMESNGSTDSSESVEVIYENVSHAKGLKSFNSKIPHFDKQTEKNSKNENSSGNIFQHSTRPTSETKFRVSNIPSFKKRKISDDDLFGVEYAGEVNRKNCKSSPDKSQFKQLISASYRRVKENPFKSEEDYEFAIRELMMSLEYPLVPRFQLNDRSNKKMDAQPHTQIGEVESSVNLNMTSSENYLSSNSEKVDLEAAYSNGKTITSPETGNVILFKILKLGSDYTPQMSGIIQAKVISYATDSQQLHLNIIYGADEFSIPSGKFALNEDDEAIISRELNWNEMIEPRLMSSQNKNIL